MNDSTRAFLTAEWKYLAMINYQVNPAILTPLVPAGTELDFWQGKTFVSVVGFLFQQTRVLGIPVPFHRDFEEVNLRFYVRRQTESGWRRGVVFVRELVPRRAIAAVARRWYHEPYVAIPMAHRIQLANGIVQAVEYSWRYARRENSLKVVTAGPLKTAADGSEAEFITEHYWGYTRQPDGSTLEYRVEHPRWEVQDATDAQLNCDIGGLYGDAFSLALNKRPVSAFVAAGSAVTVYRGSKLPR